MPPLVRRTLQHFHQLLITKMSNSMEYKFSFKAIIESLQIQFIEAVLSSVPRHLRLALHRVLRFYCRSRPHSCNLRLHNHQSIQKESTTNARKAPIDTQGIHIQYTRAEAQYKQNKHSVHNHRHSTKRKTTFNSQERRPSSSGRPTEPLTNSLSTVVA